MNKQISILVLWLTFAAAALAAGIPLRPVQSSLISRAGYDPGSQTLAVEMASNADVYYYKGVPPAVYAGFLAAESKAAFFASQIKGKYPERLSP